MLSAEILLAQGQADAASRTAEEALEQARGAQMRHAEALARRLAGEGALSAGAAAWAARLLRQSLGMLEELGARLDAERCRMLLVQALVQGPNRVPLRAGAEAREAGEQRLHEVGQRDL